MNKFKYLLAALFAAALAGAVIVACDENDNPKNEGLKAGLEMCACVASHEPPQLEDFESLEAFQAAFYEYAAKLQGCLGVIAKYEKYVTAGGTYDPTAEEPLLSIFEFKDEQFKEGFTEGVGTCKDAFTSLFALMGQGQ